MKMFFSALLFAVLVLFQSNTAFADDPPKTPTPQTDAQKLEAAIARQRELEAEIEKLKTKPADPPKPDDDDLRTKAAKEKKERDDKASDTKKIEAALSFNLGVDDFIKKNADLLPKEISDIVRVAHKETYDSATGKAATIKASIVQAYFAVQSNIDALTATQRETLDDYLKLTKTGKEDKAAEIYGTIFEPALETFRKVKKAEEVGRARAGFSNSTDADAAYKEKLIKASRKHYLNEKDA